MTAAPETQAALAPPSPPGATYNDNDGDGPYPYYDAEFLGADLIVGVEDATQKIGVCLAYESEEGEQGFDPVAVTLDDAWLLVYGVLEALRNTGDEYAAAVCEFLELNDEDDDDDDDED